MMKYTQKKIVGPSKNGDRKQKEEKKTQKVHIEI